MDFFYTPPHLITPPSLVIEGDEFSHLVHVMRKGLHDEISVVDGNGNVYDAEISTLDRRSAMCTVKGHRTFVNEPTRKVVLGAALLRHSGNFDFLVEKVTEIGVHAIVPLRTERTIPSKAKIDRWQKLALAAMKQSQRCYLPIVRQATTVRDCVESADGDSTRLLPHESTAGPLLTEAIPAEAQKIILAIGPEGGFTQEEVLLASGHGFIVVSLGPRRLRAETAAIVATAGSLLRD